MPNLANHYRFSMGWLLLILSFLSVSLHAGSIRLKNNSRYQLRVIVEGSDGSHLGEVLIKAQDSLNWTDTYGQRSNNRGAQKPLQRGDSSKTPYTISWYCMDGGLYSSCSDVAVGSLIMANACPGPRTCKEGKKQGYPDRDLEENSH
ncbi:MAG: hypothetical protein HYZ48_01100 [Chlamydiales bacterium]|nr:hypothetical protein [Chlamydiales bacterium]